MSDGSGSKASDIKNSQEKIQSSEVPNRYVDAAISLVIVIVAVGLFLRSGKFSIIQNSQFDPGAAFWPRAALIIIIIAGIINLVIIYRQLNNDKSTNATALTWLANGIQPSRLRDTIVNDSTTQLKYVASIVTMVVYLVLLTPMGFLSATPLFLFSFGWITGYRSPVKLVVFSVLTTIFLFVVFRVVVNLSLPVGNGIFREFTFIVQQIIGNFIP